ncbi:YqjF family protein [Salinibaculum rarum]|uniref:YqjF family protein n=1 Tax=Salinibaculum rarum TaxID=3058903 RepID=UPI00265DA667|nr:DUF2071 domain-containing protein [Salinibaculum sp. KK48]
MPAFEMEWRDVFFASFPVDPAVVSPQLPDRLSLDTFDGDAYLSVVPFVIGDIRPRGLPAAVGVTTPELNLRTYVRLDDAPGVYFFNLDAGDLLGVVGARLFNQLPYYYADMDYERGPPTRFESRRRTPGARPLDFAATYGPDGDPYRPDPGTVEHFLVERYRYFTEGQDGTLRYADIEHEPWTLRPGTWTVEKNTIFAANGFNRPDSDPILSHSHGLAVSASTSEEWGR